MPERTKTLTREKFMEAFERAVIAFGGPLYERDDRRVLQDTEMIEAVRKVAKTTKLVRVGSARAPGCLVKQAERLHQPGAVRLAVRCDAELMGEAGLTSLIKVES